MYVYKDALPNREYILVSDRLASLIDLADGAAVLRYVEWILSEMFTVIFDYVV